MLRIYREMLESGDLKREDAELIKANLDEEKKQIKEELDQLYNDGGMLNHSAEIANRENSEDEINELLDKINQILSGHHFPEPKKEEKEEPVEEPEVIETKEYEDDFEEDEPENEYEDVEETEEFEDQEIPEDDEPEKAGIKENLEEMMIEIIDILDEKYKEEATNVIEGRKDLQDLSKVMEKGERSARLVMEKIGGSEEHELEQESTKDKSQDYDKDERTR